MDVKILQAFTTAAFNVNEHFIGRTLRVSPEVGAEWCAAGRAEPATAEAEAELAESTQVETESTQVETPEDAAPKPTTAETKALERLTKVELLRACQEKGVDASESETKAELITKLTG